MTSLPAFLLARLAEDEAAARAVAEPRWTAYREGLEPVREDDTFTVTAVHARPGDGWPIQMGYRTAAHIARHDPARVLADVAAKRALVMTFDGHLDEGDGYAAAAEMTLLALASVYRDHADYDGGWAL